MRQCSKPGCSKAAVATLTYNYNDSTAVLGPLSTSADPHAFDMCELHAESLTVPRGWEVVRLQTKFDSAPPSADDLLALVEAIRDVAGKHSQPDQRTSEYFESDPQIKNHDPHVSPPMRREQFTVVSGEADSPAVFTPKSSPVEGVFKPEN